MMTENATKVKTLLFCGQQSPYGFKHLEEMLKSHFNVVGAVLAPNKTWTAFQRKLLGCTEASFMGWLKYWVRQWRMLRGSWEAISLLQKYKIPYLFIEDVNTAYSLKRIQSFNADLFFCAAYPQIFVKEMLRIPSGGAINSHPSLLPKYRGAHPHFWTIVNGETQTGLTTHYMTTALDSGDIIAQVSLDIGPEDTYSLLYENILSRVAQLISETENVVLKRIGEPRAQDNDKATFYHNDKPQNRQIHWDIQSSREIYNLIRTEVAFFCFRNKKICVKKVFVEPVSGQEQKSAACGIISSIDGESIFVRVKDGFVRIITLKEGLVEMSAGRFAQRYRLIVGNKL